VYDKYNAGVIYRRQKEILDLITKSIDKFGYAPTLTEIAQNLGLSSLSTVHEHLAALEKKGLIRRYRGAVRGIELLDNDEKIMMKLNYRYWVLSLVGHQSSPTLIQMQP